MARNPARHLKKVLYAVLLAAPLVTSSLMGGGFGCADRIDSLLEEAKFFLDSCDPTNSASLTNCTNAATKADSIQTTDPTNIEAAIIESSARLGLAGFDFLQLAQRLADLGNVATNDFAEFRNLVSDVEAANGRVIDLSELTLAITPLTTALAGLTGATDEEKRAFFQLGMLQAIDAFIRPVKLAGSDASAVTTISAAEATTVNGDFVGGDTNLVLSGTTEDDILRPIRENFCRCSLQAPLGGTAGFSAGCVRDLMRCELSDTAVPEQDYNSDAALSRVDCLTLLTPGGLTACGGTDTN